MVNGIIFDFDGVLVHSERANIEAAIKTFNDIGKPLTQAEVKTIPGRSSLDFIPLFSRRRGIDSSATHQELYERNRENYKTLWTSVVSMFGDGKTTVESLLSQGKKLGIATTNRRETVEMFFNKFKMGAKFSAVVSGEQVKERKPNPEVYVLAIQEMNLPREELIAVEDTSIGLRAAKAAGLPCAVIPNEYTEHEDFSEADFVLSSLQDLLALS
jgi:beta-phosphoglucomutase